MSKGNTWEDDLLKLMFQNVNAADIGDSAGLRGSTTAGNLFVSLHTADPGEGGGQNTSETAYTGYGRMTVARSTAGWTVSTGSVSPATAIDFGECTTSPGSAITHFGIGVTGGTTAGKLLYSGTVSPNITMAIGVIPRLKTTSAITED